MHRLGFRLPVIALALSLFSVPALAQNLQSAPAWPGVTLPTFVIPASAVGGGGTFPVQLFGPDGSATVPPYSFTSATNTGWYRGTSSGRLIGSVAGAAQVAIDSSTGFVAVRSDGFFGFLSSTAPDSAGIDAEFARDAADVIAQRRGTNAQAFRSYNTYTDASNYERMLIGWSANTAFLTTDAQGTGSSRDLVVGSTGAGGVLLLRAGGSNRWRVNTSGHFIPESDNSYDVGASGATSPRTVYSSTSFKTNSGASYSLSVPAAINTAITVTSAGTSPSITTNGSVTGRVNVGTGGTATTIVLAMPTATTGWNCYSNNITAAAANRANLHMVQQASTTTSATLQWQTLSTGAATAFTASDIVSYICFAY